MLPEALLQHFGYFLRLVIDILECLCHGIITAGQEFSSLNGPRWTVSVNRSRAELLDSSRSTDELKSDLAFELKSHICCCTVLVGLFGLELGTKQRPSFFWWSQRGSLLHNFHNSPNEPNQTGKHTQSFV